MRTRTPTVTTILASLALASALALAACGGDDDTATDTTGDPQGGSPQVEGSADDGDLLVPRDYLQGQWCDSDGQTWTITGDTAEFDDGSGGVAQLPVDLVFIDDVDTDLASRSDDEFVIANDGDEVTFTRGGC